jgi:hypothetical protein
MPYLTDPSITMRGLQQPESVGELISRYAQLKNMAVQRKAQEQQTREGEFRLQELQRMSGQNQAEDAAIWAAVQEAGGIREALPKISQIAPQRGLEIGKKIAEWDKQSAEAKLKKLELERANGEAVGRLVIGVNSEETKNAAVQEALRQGLITPERAQQLAQTPYSPEMVNQIAQQAVGMLEWNKQETARINAETARTKANEPKELPASMQEFEREYAAWLEVNGLQRNAKNEMAFRDMKRKQDIADAIAKRPPREPKEPYDVDYAVDGLSRRIMTMADVPQAMRPAVNKRAKELGVAILSEKQWQALDKLGMVANIHSELNRISSRVNTNIPVISNVVGTLRSGAQKLGFDEDVTQLVAMKSQLGPLARSISQEVGVLTDPDIQRVQAAVPVATDSEQNAQAKLRVLENFIRLAEEMIRESAGKTALERKALFDKRLNAWRATADGATEDSKVPMIGPDGKEYYVPSDKVEEAKRDGGKIKP